MNTTPEEEFTSFWLMPEERLKRHIVVLEQIAKLRASLREDVSEPCSPKVAPRELQAPPSTPKTVIHRAPMRMPKEGSLRSDIQQVLKAHGHPMSRDDVTESVAKLRQTPATPKLRDKVGQALGNRHDPFFARVETGLFRLNEEVLHVA